MHQTRGQARENGAGQGGDAALVLRAWQRISTQARLPPADTQTLCIPCLAPPRYCHSGRRMRSSHEPFRLRDASAVFAGKVFVRNETRNCCRRGQLSLSEPRAPNDECHDSRDDQNDNGHSSNDESVRRRPRVPRAKVCDVKSARKTAYAIRSCNLLWFIAAPLEFDATP